MKKVISALLVTLFAVVYAADVTPTLSLRIDNMLNGLEFASPIIGLEMGLEGANTGFDANTTSTRIYIERSYGKIGLGTYTAGHADAGSPYFTVGSSFDAYNNLSIELEYVVNSLAATTADALQMSLIVGF